MEVRKFVHVRPIQQKQRFVLSIHVLEEPKQFRIFFIELGKPCSSPTLSYEDNVASIHAVQTIKPSPRLRYIDIPLSYLHQEFDMKTIEPVHAPARHVLVDFLTKPKSGQSVLRKSSCLMGHVHLSSLPP